MWPSNFQETHSSGPSISIGPFPINDINRLDQMRAEWARATTCNNEFATTVISRSGYGSLKESETSGSISQSSSSTLSNETTIGNSNTENVPFRHRDNASLHFDDLQDSDIEFATGRCSSIGSDSTTLSEVSSGDSGDGKQSHPEENPKKSQEKVGNWNTNRIMSCCVELDPSTTIPDPEWQATISQWLSEAILRLINGESPHLTDESLLRWASSNTIQFRL